jgi:UDP-N-acetylglucosamine transferase subunit ALG13
MILVLLGTQNNSFHRLLKEVEKNIDNKNINEEVVVQAGYTKYETEKMQVFETLPKEELGELIKKANYVISHGGVGSMITSNQEGKKVIAVPRQKKYQEHVNDHQKATVQEFEQKGYVLGIEEVEELGEAIKKLKEFQPVIYKKKESNVIKIIEEYIENH